SRFHPLPLFQSAATLPTAAWARISLIVNDPEHMFFFYPKLRQLHRSLALGLQDELFRFCFRGEKPSAAFPVLSQSCRYPNPITFPCLIPVRFHTWPVCCSLLLFFKVFVADLSLLTTFANTCLPSFQTASAARQAA